MTNKAEPVDMSRSAITARLEDVRQLYRLSLYLLEVGHAAGLNRGVWGGHAKAAAFPDD